MTMMSGTLDCDRAEEWVYLAVLRAYPVVVMYAAQQPTDAPGTTVRLLWHAHTTADGRRLAVILEGVQATLKALRFMGHVRVAETVECRDSEREEEHV